MDILKEKILDLSGILEDTGDLPDEEKERARSLLQNLNYVVDKASPLKARSSGNSTPSTLQDSTVKDLQGIPAIEKVPAQPDTQEEVANTSLPTSSVMCDPMNSAVGTSQNITQSATTKTIVMPSAPTRKRGRPKKDPLQHAKNTQNINIKPNASSAKLHSSEVELPLKPFATKCEDGGFEKEERVSLSSSGRPKRTTRLPAKLTDSSPTTITCPKKVRNSTKHVPRWKPSMQSMMSIYCDERGGEKRPTTQGLFRDKQMALAVNDEASQGSEDGLEPGELDWDYTTEDLEAREHGMRCCYICIGHYDPFKGDTQEELVKHVKEKHTTVMGGIQFLECPVCQWLLELSQEEGEKEFSSHNMCLMLRHMVQEHQMEYPEFAKVIKCPECDYRGIDKKDIVIHQVNKHRMKCKLCHKIVRKNYIQTHLQTVHAHEVVIVGRTGVIQKPKTVDVSSMHYGNMGRKMLESIRPEDMDPGSTASNDENILILDTNKSDSSASQQTSTSNIDVIHVVVECHDDPGQSVMADEPQEQSSPNSNEADVINEKQPADISSDGSTQFTLEENDTLKQGKPSKPVAKSKASTKSDHKAVGPFNNQEWEKYFENDSSLSWSMWEEDDQDKDGQRKDTGTPAQRYCLLCIGTDSHFRAESVQDLASHLVEEHLASVGEDHYLRCPDCCKTFKLSSQFKIGLVNRDTRACMIRVMMHRIRMHNCDLPSFLSVERCEECEFVAPNRREIQNHMKTQHGHGRVKCQLCGKSVVKHYIKLHMSHVHNRDDGHSSRGDLHCLLCPGLPPFTQTIRLARHIEQSHLVSHQEVDYINCPECQQRFKLNKRFDVTRLNRTVMGVMEYTLRHLTRTHGYKYPDYTRTYKYQCKDCGFVAPNKFDLKLHRGRSHQVGRVKCPICQQFFTKAYLQEHIAAKHKDKSEKAISEIRQTCHLCNKDFCSKATLSAHTRMIHCESRQYLCDQCTFSTRYKNKYQDHLFRDHGKNEEMKPIYQCGEEGCDYQTLMRDRLQAHMMIHGNENLECDICGMDFINLAKLKGHKKRIHAENKTVFPCPFCQERCCRRHVLARHVQRHHPQEVTFDPKTVKAIPTSSLSPVSEETRAPMAKRRRLAIRSRPAILKKSKMEYEAQAYREDMISSEILAGTEALLVYQDDTPVPSVGNTETIEGTVVQIDPNIASLIQRHQVDETVKVMSGGLLRHQLEVADDNQAVAMETHDQVVYEEEIDGTTTVTTSGEDMSLLAQALLAVSENQGGYVVVQEDTELPQVGHTEEVEENMEVELVNQEAVQVNPGVTSIIHLENPGYQTVYLSNSEQPEVLEAYLKYQDTGI